MNTKYFFEVFMVAAVLVGSVFYLLRSLHKDKELISIVGLFCLAMGFFLLALDVVLVSATHGPRYLHDYLLFNRLVADTGFAGRWVFTSYVFICAGMLTALYLLSRDLIHKFFRATKEESV